MAKKRTGKKKAKKKAVKKSVSRRSRREAQTAGDAAPGEVDLAEVLRREGIVEERIPEAVSLIRAMSDAQAGEDTPPPVPIQPPVESAEERRVAIAADAVLAETERWRVRTRRVIATARATTTQGHRDSLWDLELQVLADRPRISYVGRGIHQRTRASRSVATYSGVFEAINAANSSLLSETVCNALRLVRDGSTAIDPLEKRRQEKSATSTLRKNLDKRIYVLVNRMRYATARQGRNSVEYRLTKVGDAVFNGWPDWHSPDAAGHVEDSASPEATEGPT